MVRTIDSNCLLCNEAKATKTNSHIVPKFLTKSLLGKGVAKRAFTVSSKKADKPPIISQDSPKQDFMLCPDCELYFSVLETEASGNFYSGVWDFERANKFTTKKTQTNILYRESVKLNSRLFHLFVYSILWRCSVTHVELFKFLKLDQIELEELRKGLLTFRATTQKDALEKVAGENWKALPSGEYVLLTGERFSDQTANVVFVPEGNQNPYILILNQFLLMISLKENTKQGFLREFANITSKEGSIKIVFLPEAAWQLILQRLVTQYAGASKRNLESLGRRPYAVPVRFLK